MSKLGITATILATGLCDAVTKDEAGEGLDISAGMFGAETSKWLRSVAVQVVELETHKDALKAELEANMQPVINGRFKENKIVSYCLENNTDMNDIAHQDFSEEDRMQFAQLIGYSVGGYGTLSYVSDSSHDLAYSKL